MDAILAIDPGKTGGIAWKSFLDDERVNAYKMPVTPKEIHDAIRDYWPGDVMRIHAYIENVHARPKNGSMANFKLGNNFGHLEMALIAAGISFERVSSVKWMRGLGVPAKLEHTVRKNWIKGRMQERYPGLKVTLATADALGILTWAMARDGAEREV